MVSQDPYFDMLPNELVAKILTMAMHTESFLCFQHIIWRLNQPLFARPEHKQSTGNPNAQPKEPLGTEHTAHLFDWGRMSRTSRRFREIGKPAYWQCKTIVVSKEFVNECVKGHEPGSRGLTPEDRDLALRNIRSAVVYRVRHVSPSFFVALPKYMAQFPTLQRLVLSSVHWTDETATAVWVSAEEGRERVRRGWNKEYVADMPGRMQTLLWAVGVDPCVSVKLLTLPWDWNDAVEELQRNVYPMMEFRAKLLQSRQEKAGAAEESVVKSADVR